MIISRTALVFNVLVIGGVVQTRVKEEIKPLLNHYIAQTAAKFAKIDQEKAAKANDPNLSEEERDEEQKLTRKLKQLECRAIKNILKIVANKKSNQAKLLSRQARLAAESGREDALRLQKDAEAAHIEARVANGLAEAYNKNVYEMWRYEHVLVGSL
jgi:hypothetical protein